MRSHHDSIKLQDVSIITILNLHVKKNYLVILTNGMAPLSFHNRISIHIYVRYTYIDRFTRSRFLCWSRCERDTQKWGLKYFTLGTILLLVLREGNWVGHFYPKMKNVVGHAKYLILFQVKKYSDWNWESINIFIWVFVVEINSHWILILEGNCLMTQFDPEYF